jgi:hypothetical protein
MPYASIKYRESEAHFGIIMDSTIYAPSLKPNYTGALAIPPSTYQKCCDVADLPTLLRNFVDLVVANCARLPPYREYSTSPRHRWFWV